MLKRGLQVKETARRAETGLFHGPRLRGADIPVRAMRSMEQSELADRDVRAPSPFGHIRESCEAGRLPMLAALLWLSLSFAGAASFTASLDRDTITLGESATLSLTFTGAGVQGAPSLPPIEGLDVGSTGSQMGFNMVNGQTT